MKVITIVEGEGEVEALPVLLRRLGEWRTPQTFVQVPRPIRVRRNRFLNREEEFRRHILLASAKCEGEDWILVLLDADDDCPADLGGRVQSRAKKHAPHQNVSVVLANREYEAWFIASAQSLNGQRGFVFNRDEAIDPETPRDAKSWMRNHMETKAYREITDQPAFSARMNLQQAFEHSRSFRKLCAEWDQQLMERKRGSSA